MVSVFAGIRFITSPVEHPIAMAKQPEMKNFFKIDMISTDLNSDVTLVEILAETNLGVTMLTTPRPNLLWLKKAQAIWRGVLTAEVLKFPHRRSHVIQSLLETAKRLEKTAPEDCIAIQGQVIAMLSVEVSQSRRTAYAAMRAMSAMSKGDEGV